MADYLKIPEVARRLDVSEKTARRYVKSGEIPSAFIAGTYRVSEEGLAEYLRSAEVKPGKGRAPNMSGHPEIEASTEGGNDLLEKVVGGSWIQQMNYHAAVCEKVVERGDSGLDWLRDINSMAVEFYMGYRYTVREFVRSRCTPEQLDYLDAAEQRMGKAMAETDRAFSSKLEEERGRLDQGVRDDLERQRKLREERMKGLQELDREAVS